MSRKKVDINYNTNTKKYGSVVTCGYCKGTGKDPSAFVTLPCPACGGKGKVRI
ncbi:MAG: hypothetical protein ABR909_04800 [Candidatus Bathyarchaeia archaeon]|jgi:DnaJ-class molecular chaperone